MELRNRIGCLSWEQFFRTVHNPLHAIEYRSCNEPKRFASQKGNTVFIPKQPSQGRSIILFICRHLWFIFEQMSSFSDEQFDLWLWFVLKMNIFSDICRFINRFLMWWKVGRCLTALPSWLTCLPSYAHRKSHLSKFSQIIRTIFFLITQNDQFPTLN